MVAISRNLLELGWRRWCGERLTKVGFTNNSGNLVAIWPAVRSGVGCCEVNYSTGAAMGVDYPVEVFGAIVDHFLAEVAAGDVEAAK